MDIYAFFCYNKFSPPKWLSLSLKTIFLFDRHKTSTSVAESSKRTQRKESSQHKLYFLRNINAHIRFLCHNAKKHVQMT